MNKYIFFSYYDWLLLIENYIENKHRHHERDIFFVYNYVKVENNSLFICYALIYYSYLKIILWNNVVLYLTLKNIETVEIEDKIGRHMVFNFKKFHLIHSVLKYWLSKLCLIETPIIQTIIYPRQLLDHRIIHVFNLNYDYILGHNRI